MGSIQPTVPSPFLSDVHSSSRRVGAFMHLSCTSSPRWVVKSATCTGPLPL